MFFRQRRKFHPHVEDTEFLREGTSKVFFGGPCGNFPLNTLAYDWTEQNTGHSFFALRPQCQIDCGPGKIAFQEKTFSVKTSSSTSKNNIHWASPSTKIPISPINSWNFSSLKNSISIYFFWWTHHQKFHKLEPNFWEVDYKNKSFFITNYDFIFYCLLVWLFFISFFCCFEC